MQTFPYNYRNFYYVNLYAPKLKLSSIYRPAYFKTGLTSRNSNPGLHNGPWLDGYKFVFTSMALGDHLQGRDPKCYNGQ